jgi:crossover junction endodeoxyribonuclease RuvC
MRVLGLDPGSVRMGYGCVEVRGPDITYVEAGTISAPQGKTVYERLASIGADLAGVLSDLHPDVVALEKGFVSEQRGKLQQGALVSAAARGVAGYLAARADVPIVEYANNTIKSVVAGHGRADKAQVARMVKQALGLRKTPASDAADALAAAICHALVGLSNARIDRAIAGAA